MTPAERVAIREAVEEEREACAKLAENHWIRPNDPNNPDRLYAGMRAAARGIAALIRERGEIAKRVD